MYKTMYKNNQRGFSLIEVLIVIGILSILLGMVVGNMSRLNDRLDFETTGQVLSQDIKRLRADAMTKGNLWRLQITSLQTYVLEEQDSGTWVSKVTRQLADDVSLSNVTIGDTLTFDTRGFADFDLSGNDPSYTNEIHVTFASDTLRLIAAMSGAVRIIPL